MPSVTATNASNHHHSLGTDWWILEAWEFYWCIPHNMTHTILQNFQWNIYVGKCRLLQPNDETITNHTYICMELDPISIITSRHTYISSSYAHSLSSMTHLTSLANAHQADNQFTDPHFQQTNSLFHFLYLLEFSDIEWDNAQFVSSDGFWNSLVAVLFSSANKICIDFVCIAFIM